MHDLRVEFTMLAETKGSFEALAGCPFTRRAGRETKIVCPIRSSGILNYHVGLICPNQRML